MFNPLAGGFYFMKITVREMTEIAMLVGVAILLDTPLLKFRIGANGGSISLTMIPLIILALRVGPIKGFISIGLIYGFLSCLADGEPFYALPFDYFLGYGSLAIIGFFKNRILTKKPMISGIFLMMLSIFIAFIMRLIFSSISSVIFYEINFVGGLIYNLTYMAPAFAAVLVVLLLLYKPLIDINNRFPLKSI